MNQKVGNVRKLHQKAGGIMLLWSPHYAKYANPTKIKAQFIVVCVEVGNDSTHSCVYNVSRCTAVIHMKLQ